MKLLPLYLKTLLCLALLPVYFNQCQVTSILSLIMCVYKQHGLLAQWKTFLPFVFLAHFISALCNGQKLKESVFFILQYFTFNLIITFSFPQKKERQRVWGVKRSRFPRFVSRNCFKRQQEQFFFYLKVITCECKQEQATQQVQ